MFGLDENGLRANGKFYLYSLLQLSFFKGVVVFAVGMEIMERKLHSINNFGPGQLLFLAV